MNNDYGSILMEVAVATGILMIASTAVLSLSQVSMQASSQTTARNNFNNLVATVNQIVNNSSDCTQNFSNLINQAFTQSQAPTTVPVNQLSFSQSGSIKENQIYNRWTRTYEYTTSGTEGTKNVIQFNTGSTSTYGGLTNLQASLNLSGLTYPTPGSSQPVTPTLQISAWSGLRQFSQKIPLSIIVTNLGSMGFFHASSQIQFQSCGVSSSILSSHCYDVQTRTHLYPNQVAFYGCNNPYDVAVSGGGVCGLLPNSALWNNSVSQIDPLLVFFQAWQNNLNPLNYGQSLSLSMPQASPPGWLVGCQFAQSNLNDSEQVNSFTPIAGWAHCCPNQ